MLPSSNTSADIDGENVTCRRVRHIKGFQIRNLTPFPVRDAFTSALAISKDQHFNPRVSADDFDLFLPRNRSRKTSSTSNAARSLIREDEIADGSSFEYRNKISTPNTTASPPANGSVQTILSIKSRTHHPRTSSITSQSSNLLPIESLPPGTSSTSILSFLPDNSQSGLEKVIGSRLVETFITVTIPPADVVSGNEKSSPSQTRLRSSSIQKPFISSSHRSVKSVPKAISDASDLSSRGTFAVNGISSPPKSAPASRTSFKSFGTSQQAFIRPKRPTTHRGKGESLLSTADFAKRTVKQSDNKYGPGRMVDPPIYFSPIHRPSTNPSFFIDARSGHDFPLWTDTSGQRLKVEVWGKTPGDEFALQEKPHSLNEVISDTRRDWRLLDEWDINLNNLVPLPEDLDADPSQLPSNTILVTLSPLEQTLYFPSSRAFASRSPTPSAGYTSDPESDIRKANLHCNGPESQLDDLQAGQVLPLSQVRHYRGADSRVKSKTAGWQELFKLVTLQSLILDNESVLGDIVRKVDGLLEEDVPFSLKRVISEREARNNKLKTNLVTLTSQNAQRKLEITDRSHRIEQRSSSLISASYSPSSGQELEKTIEIESKQLVSLCEKIHYARASLLSTLSTIFPIELYSSADLLFTILDVPLPIPLTPNDPAPPASLPDHKEVTDEAVATALGSVAQVLQILAAYIGKRLIYPVTCIGSRSLIRDGISSMLGPRMFPLFSKGVDTYRFEYGVFLLNKDIEMLMSERDLRALDIRHTLPNLKNLLLTLSHNGLQNSKPINIEQESSPVTSNFGLETSLVASSIDRDASTPKASRIDSKIPDEFTQTASGANTPTAFGLYEQRKTKSFLGFVPFTDFLRGRYSSTSQLSDVVTSSQKGAPLNGTNNEPLQDVVDSEEIDPEEDDRMTIHAPTLS